MENKNVKRQRLKKDFVFEQDIPFKREALSKHSQLMQMYLRNNNIEFAKTQFDIVKRLFNSLNHEGEIMSYYTPQDFERDSKQFEKIKI